MLAFRLNKYKPINSRGDTILEVVIAITILSLLLTGALALTQKNLQDERASQEHNDALQLAQSQIEEMRAYATKKVLPTGSNFCLINNAGQLAPQIVGAVVPTPCIVDSGGAEIMTATEPEYTVSITPPAALGTLYRISVTWNSVTGHGNDNVTLYYQIYS